MKAYQYLREEVKTFQGKPIKVRYITSHYLHRFEAFVHNKQFLILDVWTNKYGPNQIIIIIIIIININIKMYNKTHTRG